MKKLLSRNPSFTIRTTLLSIIGLLALLITIVAGFGVVRAAANLEKMKELQGVSSATNLLFNAANNFSIERGATMSVYGASDIDPQVKSTLYDQISQAREASARSLDRAFEIITPNKNNNPDLAAAVEAVNVSREAVLKIGRQVDAALAGAPAQRNRDLPDQVFYKITDLITQIQKLRDIYSRGLMGVNARVTEQMMFKYFVWDITEYAGREYAVIGNLIATNKPLSQSLQKEMFAWRGRIAQGWEMAYQLAETGGLTPVLTPNLEEAETHYFTTFDLVKDIFYVPGVQVTEEAPYPISVEIWLELALQAVDSLVTLKDVSLKETQSYVDNLKSHAENTIMLNSIILISALFLSFVSIRIIMHRVIRPINAMVDALYREARGGAYAVQSVADANVHDEIGKLSLVLGVFQKNAQQIRQTSLELEDRKNHLNAILAAIMDAIVTIDREGRIQSVNPATEAMFNYTEHELIGEKLTVLMSFPCAREHDNYFAHFRQTGNVAVFGKEREIEARDKNGALFPVELSVSEMHSNGALFFVAAFRDITDRKEAEEDRIRYLRDLEISNRELNDFAYVASHDLKEPLRGIHNFSQFLLEDYSDKLDNEGQQMLLTLTRLTQQLEEYLNALLQYSRLGRTEMSIQETDLNDIVQKATEVLAIKIKETGTVIDIPQKLPVIICDQVRIREVFQNLISNALKYNDKPSGRRIEIGFTTEHPLYPEKTVFYVQDNGIGILPQHLTTIFRIFKRLHKKNAYGGGTGCGLTIVQKIVNQHGGTIWAESDGKDKGTAFFFTLSEASFHSKERNHGSEDDARPHTHH